MAENIVAKDLQKLDPGSELVQLYELEYVKGSFIYFMSGLDTDLTEVQMRDYFDNSVIRTYIAIPVKLQGLEYKNDGAIARPLVSIANASNAFSNAIGTIDYDSFLGLKFIKRTTLKKYLHGESGATNPPTEFPRDVYVMDRIKAKTKTAVQIECVAPFDLQGVRIPARNVLPDRCPFIYQGAGDHLDNFKKAQSGCTWHVEGKYKSHVAAYADGTEYTVYVNIDDEYIIPSSTSFSLYSSGAVTADAYYRTTKTITRYNANGTTSSVTANNYWQAVKDNNAPGTPSDDNSAFKRVRVYSSYSHGTEYFTFSDDRDNDYVLFTDNTASSSTNGKALIWKALIPNQSQHPVPGGRVWERGDGCSKRTEGCKMRFGFSPKSVGTATSTGKANPDTDAKLPFGGYPASKAFQ